MTSDTSKGFWTSLGELYRIIDPARRRQMWFLGLLTAAGAVAEFAAIGAVVPFLSLLAEDGANGTGAWIEPLFADLGAVTWREKLIVATVLLCLAAIAAGAFRILLTWKTQDFARSAGHYLAVEVQRRTLLQPYVWHTNHNSSEQLATLEKAQLVTGSVLLPLVQAVAASVLIAAVMIALLQLAPMATIVAGGILGAAYWGLGAFAGTRLDTNSQQIDAAIESRIKLVQECAGGIRDIILDGSQERVLQQFRDVDSRLARALADNAVVATVPRYVIEALGIITIAALALFLSAREGGLVGALPVLGALALGAQRLLPLVQQLYYSWSSVASNKAIIADVVRRMEEPVAAPQARAERLPLDRSIEVRNVSFTYPGRKRPAVDAISFAMPRGARVALVGPTGSGKSTTADLLMGLLEPDSGAILVDETPVTANNLQRWRANVAHVPQALFLADATIAENVAMTEPIDLERVREAAALAQLDTFIDSLPQGYWTRVGERGARMSGGQRQRLAIARAIYKRAPFLVLDEATSAVDNETEAAIRRALDSLQEQGVTILIIAHRSSMIDGCDLVLRLDHGRITDRAT